MLVTSLIFVFAESVTPFLEQKSVFPIAKGGYHHFRIYEYPFQKAIDKSWTYQFKVGEGINLQRPNSRLVCIHQWLPTSRNLYIQCIKVLHRFYTCPVILTRRYQLYKKYSALTSVDPLIPAAERESIANGVIYWMLIADDSQNKVISARSIK